MVIGIVLAPGPQSTHRNKKYTWMELPLMRINMNNSDEYEVEQIYNDPNADTIIIYDTDGGQHGYRFGKRSTADQRRYADHRHHGLSG